MDIFAGNKKKVCRIIHNFVKWDGPVLRDFDFILLPFGTKYHNDVSTAKRGDKIEFTDGEIGTITDICPIKIASSMFRNLCLFRYGREPLAVQNRWKRTIVALGLSPSMINPDTALVVWYKYGNNTTQVPR